MKHSVKVSGAVFCIALIVYGVLAWDRLASPSPQFHFVDLAHSFLNGRVDTDTPRSRLSDEKKTPDAPRGFYRAVARQTTNPDGSRRGWNDWSSYRILTLKSGEVLRGVFPWKDKKDERRHEFHSLDGTLYRIQCGRDVARGCYGNSADVMRYHVSFPPFPGVAMMPFAAIWGYDVNDVWFTLFFAALNVLLLFRVLEALRLARYSERSLRDNLWLTAMFAFGTVHFFCSVRGEVWFTALVLGVTLHLASIWCVIDFKRPLLAGLFLGLGAATRTPLIFGSLFIFFLAVIPLYRGRTAELRSDFNFRQALTKMVLFAIPVAVSLFALMWFNYVRFENPFEFGHSYLQEGMRENIRQHGLMSGWFFGQNLSAALTNPPVFTLEGGFPIRITRHGLGLLWTTPALLLIVGSNRKTPLFWAALITAFIVALPGLFYQNTGWVQFGYRFGLDWLPLIIVAFAVGGRRLNGFAKSLILFGMLVNLFGAVTFGRMDSVYY
jgi:hypothetical protein